MMRAWIARLVADNVGVPDEVRAMYVLAQLLYLLAWAVWFAVGGWPRWPEVITPFAAGQTALTAAFGVTLWARGKN